jgi:hypothetical protein
LIKKKYLPKNLVEKTLSEELQKKLNKKFSINDLSTEKKVIINVETKSGLLEFTIPRRNVYATNSPYFFSLDGDFINPDFINCCTIFASAN